MSHIYAEKKRAAETGQRARPVDDISKSDMLRMSGAGAPQPMSAALREKFEPGFNADFSNIRISRGHIPQEMGIQAVAKGTDILIDSRAGMDVLGHELAHVVQQAQGQVQGGFPVVHNAALEHQADVMGARAASGLSAMEGGMSGFGGGEMMSIAPMSGAEAPAQCKSRLEKRADKERSQMETPEYLKSQQSLRAYIRHGVQQEAWRKQLAPSAGEYIKTEDMGSAPTMGREETDALVENMKRSMLRGEAKGKKVDAAMQAFYQDSTASRSSSPAGDIGRRMEAMFDDSGSEGADAYNQTMMTSLNELQMLMKGGAKEGTISDQQLNFQGIVDTFSPMMRELKQMQGDGEGYQARMQEYAKRDYGGAKNLMGKMHAFQDVAKKFDPETKEKLAKAVGWGGGYGEYNKAQAGFNVASAQAWREQGGKLGIGTLGALHSGIAAALNEGRLNAPTPTAAPAAAPTAPAQSGWRRAEVSDEAYNQAPNQMAGSHRNGLSRLRRKGWY